MIRYHASSTTILCVAILAISCHSQPEDVKGPAADAPPDSAPRAAIARADTSGADTTDGVTVTGRVIGEDSGEPVPSAYVVVLVPGVRFDEWEAATGEETERLIRAAVRADSTGAYRVPRLERGRDYTVMIAARRYKSAAFDLGLTIAPDAPAIKRIDPVALEPAIW